MGEQDNKKKFGDILKKNGILDTVSEVDVKEFGAGENFGSKIQLVTIKFEKSDKSPLNLFTKSMVENSDSAKILDEMKLFEKEARFFNQFYPAVKEFCHGFGQDELLKIYPKCYHGDEKFMVFENLVLKGFSMVDKEELQDYEAARLSFTSIAKHHALSRAFIKQIGGREEFLRRFPNFDFDVFCSQAGRDMMEPAMEKAITRDIDILDKTENAVGKEKAIAVLKSYQGKCCEKLVKTLQDTQDNEEILTLIHGDYWNNNMMFRKDAESGKYTDHILVDFQACRYGSPSVDLHYFVFQSVQPPVRKEKLMDLLKAYYETLVDTSLKLQCPFEVSFEEVFLNFRQYVVLGFLMGIAADNGLCFKVIKDLSADDLKVLGEKLDELIQQWIENHPEERQNVAKGIIGLVEEYLNLKID